eukprot:gene4691-8263_t
MEEFRHKPPSALNFIFVMLFSFNAFIHLYSLAFSFNFVTFNMNPRKMVLIFCGALYYIRFLILMLYTTQRVSPVVEIVSVNIFVGGIFTAVSYASSLLKDGSIYTIDYFFLILVLFGSYMNTGSEVQRKHWKLKPENKGKLYMYGLASITQHPNYTGDLILFSGWMLLTTYKILLIVPMIMICGFTFLSIPELNEYLKKKYSREYEQYQKNTPYQLIPFIY